MARVYFQQGFFFGGGALGKIDFLVHLALTSRVNPIHSNSDSGKFVLLISVSLPVVDSKRKQFMINRSIDSNYSEVGSSSSSSCPQKYHLFSPSIT